MYDLCLLSEYAKELEPYNASRTASKKVVLPLPFIPPIKTTGLFPSKINSLSPAYTPKLCN